MSKLDVNPLADQLIKQLVPTAPIAFSDRLQHSCLRFAESAETSLVEKLLADLAADNTLAQQLGRLWICSDYALDTCCARPALIAELIQGDDLYRCYNRNELRLRLANFDALLTQGAALIEALSSQLRKFRQREMLRIIWRDLNSLASMEQTAADLSSLADSCLDHALEQIYADLVARYGAPLGEQGGREQQLVVLGMGKLGARELNLSSDIDLIFAFPEAGHTHSDSQSISNQEFFTQVGKALIRVIDARTVDGFVFRVDMRLRPNGDSGPLVLNFSAMEDYYQQHGREWERFAMVKARAVAGDINAGQRLLATLRPFVYRRYLDFGAIDALRDMKRLIQQQVKQQGLQHDIKLGAGGIREAEFIVQSFQLIHGGKHPDFQVASFFEVLPVLLRHRCLPPGDVEQLASAYRFLRRVEHALQAWRDEQTQTLPDNGDREACARLAYALEFFDTDKSNAGQQFTGSLAGYRETIQRQFADIVADADTETSSDDAVEKSAQVFWHGFWYSAYLRSADIAVKEIPPEFCDKLVRLSPETLQRLKHFASSRQLLAMEKAGRERLDRLMPVLLCACESSEDLSLAIDRLLPIIEAVLRRTAYIALLIENPLALQHLVRLSVMSPWVAEHLARYPLLIDELLDHRHLYTVPGREDLADELRQHLLRVNRVQADGAHLGDDLERVMHALRLFKLAHSLRVAACQVMGSLPLMKISDYHSHLAEVILQAVLHFAWREMVQRYGSPSATDYATQDTGALCEHFIIVAYGKLGGIELGPSSDLDLVFIHNLDEQAETKTENGNKAVTNAVFFTRLSQRIIHILSTQTISGALYEVDMRLRPSGGSGLLVSSFAAFARYQKENAWTWEHQALVRARPVAGDAALASQFTALREQILCRSRPIAELRSDVNSMRQKMREQLPAIAVDTFDLKQGVGGIVDIEFIVQYSVLAHAAQHPLLAHWTDNVRIIESLAGTGLLTTEQACQLTQAYIDYRSAAHLVALQQQDKQDTEHDERFARHRENVSAIWRQLLIES